MTSLSAVFKIVFVSNRNTLSKLMLRVEMHNVA